MNLSSLEICELGIPFRFRYGHASARHGGVQSILCIARDTEGREGYGEAIPREYVTGETVESVKQAIPKVVENLITSGGGSLEDFQKALSTIEDGYPRSTPNCAIGAVEMAVTDLCARQAAKTVTDFLGGAKKSPLTYTASIGLGSRTKLTALLLLYRSLGLRHFKVKVGHDEDASRLRWIRNLLGSEATLFADANNSWDKETAARRIDALAAGNFWAVEEPLRISRVGHDDREAALTDEHFSNQAWLQARSPVPLIADESLISLRGARKIVDSGAFKIFNIRLSKCGGYLRSSQFAEIAEAASLSFSLGAMVGESPILAAAGAAWAASHPHHRYVQGHSHRLLHGRRFVSGCPRLGFGGRFAFHPDQRPGSGLMIDHQSLAGIVKDRFTIELT